MKILAHRGWWVRSEEKNHRTAFERAFAAGLGVETDLRDMNGEIVISHDPPERGCMSFSDFLAIHSQYRSVAGTLALNIKSDGLSEKVAALLNQFSVTDYFVFDMSVPDALSYARHNLTLLARASEYESPGRLGAMSRGIWLDSFHGEWFTSGQIVEWLATIGQIAVVSPELHGRSHFELWSELRRLKIGDQAWLCTDFPAAAIEYFSSTGHDSDVTTSVA